MTAQELLKPRFEVIADYPGNEFGGIGTVLDRDWGEYPDGEGKPPSWSISDFPHLFRKMNWWEGRHKDDMPKKVMSMYDEKGDTFEIQEWDMDILVGWIDKEQRSCCSLKVFTPQYGYVPID